jgi:integrase
MATVIPVKQRTKAGTIIKRWQLSYVDGSGKRHRKNFSLKRDADAERIRIESQLQTGTHIPDGASRTVLQGLQAWLDHIDELVRAGKRGLITWKQYSSHIDNHVAIRPIAKGMLSRLRPADIAAFADDLERSLSPAMARKVMATLRMGLKYCRRHEWLTTDPAKDVRIERRDSGDNAVGIPPKADLKALLAAASKAEDNGRSRALIHLLLYCGLRMGELRALTRGALTLTGNHPHLFVTQAADQYGGVKPPKSKAGRRKIPIGPETAKSLREWLVHAPPNDLRLVFPNGAGKVETHSNLANRWWGPLMLAAGLAEEVEGKGRAKRIVPQFTPHDLRHAAASLWIEMALIPKKVQELLGHESLQMTMDLYGHLWVDPDHDRQIGWQIERQL